jgi:Fe-S cluster assembly protein SufD
MSPAAWARPSVAAVGSGPSWDEWRVRLREEAAPRRTETRDESWKYTRIQLFEWPGGATASTRPVIRTAGRAFPSAARAWLALSFRQAFAEVPERLVPFVGGQARPSERPLTAYNTQGFEDGILIDVPDGATVSEPIEINLRIRSPSDPACPPGVRYLFPRVLIHLGKGAQARVIERHLWGSRCSLEPEQTPRFHPHRINAVTEIRIDRDAQLQHDLEQSGGGDTQAVGLTAVRLDRDSRYLGHSLATAGALLRHEHQLLLAEPGSEARLESLTLAGRDEHHDRQTRILHVSPNTTSHQCFYSIVAGQGMSIYGGQVVMKPHARGCTATQKNHHLLLDPSAQSRSRPSLEIAVDDVRCSHGSTSGALDPESLFYLRSRGLDETQARHLLITSFAGGFLERLAPAALRDSWQREIARVLPHLG